MVSTCFSYLPVFIMLQCTDFKMNSLTQLTLCVPCIILQYVNDQRDAQFL